MNYIKHLNAVFKRFACDPRLNPTHISLYMALFQFWNINRFPHIFYINREELMKMSKIGSKATYHRCLKNLNHWSYIVYFPSHNPYKGSRIKMLIFNTGSETSGGITTELEQGQAVVPLLKDNKQKQNILKLSPPESENEVMNFFKIQGWPSTESKKFYNHYNSLGWMTGGKAKIINWHSCAENWMIKARELKQSNASSHFKDNLKTSKIKDYDKPL